MALILRYFTKFVYDVVVKKFLVLIHITGYDWLKLIVKFIPPK